MEDGRDEQNSADELFSTLPKDERWTPLYQYRGFWILDLWLRGMLAAQRRLITRDDDIFVASCPKSGTTWLKALAFSAVHRRRHRPDDPHHPLRSASPHDCVPFLEETFAGDPDPGDLSAIPSPRMWNVHTPYSLLPASLRESGCRIVYVARDPKDVFVSLYHFMFKVSFRGKEALSMDEALEMFCSGICPYGPIWEHALEYWNEALKRPEKVLLLRYTEMKGDPLGSLRKLAAFLGRPFTEAEEREGVPAQISELCSFESLTSMGVNREGVLEKYKSLSVPTNSFFRRGEDGDWKNHLSPEMAEKLDMITAGKLQGTGLKLS